MDVSEVEKIGDTVLHIELRWWANIIAIAPFSAKPLARCKVGSTCIGSSEALKARIRGKSLKTCHHYRDALWCQ
nr:phosphopantothenoylcysteine decarboxylase-like [Tanacetum cinerariifolium]